MAMPNADQQTNSKSPPADVVASGCGDAMDRSRAMFSAGFRLWEAEAARFVNELATQGRASFEQLCARDQLIDQP